MADGKGGKGKRGSVEGKHKRPPTPPLEDFGDSEFFEGVFSSEVYDSSPLALPTASSDDSDNSMGLSTAERAYIRSIEREGLEGSND